MIAHAKEIDQHNDHVSNCFVLHSQVYAFSTFNNSYGQTAIPSSQFCWKSCIHFVSCEDFLLFSWGQLQEKNYYYAGHVSYHLSPCLKSCRHREMCILMMHMIKS